MIKSPCRLIAGLFLLICFFTSISLAADELYKNETPCMVETSVWMIANAFPDPPDFYQLSFGYQLDKKNSLFLTGITWKYWAPLGIPMWDSRFESPDEEYPGYVRAFGLGLGYQRFIWNGAFAALYAIPFHQTFYSEKDKQIQSGFQLYLQVQLGYQFNFFNGRFFIKPAMYMNYWPVNTNFPEEFKQKEKGWPNYQPFEPHLNIGFTF